MHIAIYSNMADSPEWRIARGGGEPRWSGEVPFGPADSDLATCEVIFRRFNRVTDEDVYNLEDWGYDLPSLSVGDEVTFDGKTFRVASMGFEPV